MLYEKTGLLIPPINFGMIMPKVYRSGCPTKENFEFLNKLGLRCILFVGTETLPKDYAQLKDRNIASVVKAIGMDGNKEPFVTIPPEDVSRALSIVIDTSLHPILLHSMKGRHREGVVVGCLRKLQGWSLVSIFEEYDRFCGRYKVQPIDKRYIETFSPRIKYRKGRLPEGWPLSSLPDAYTLIEEDEEEDDDDKTK